jgi:NADH-quinone oxidoreductase subunit M
VLALITGVGILVGVAYIIRTIQKAFYGRELGEVQPMEQPLPAISIPERIGAGLLMLTTLVVGLYPTILLQWIVPSFKDPLLSRLIRGDGS